MFELGKILAEGIEDCDGVITIYEQLRNKFPEFGQMDEVLFRLYYCYDKNGDHSKAAQLKSELHTKYPSSNLTTLVMTGKDPKAEQKTEATKTYENIYDLFIEGKFDDAVAQKKIADSIYGENYWTPQLLYIESVYYIKQQNDSAAISELKKLGEQISWYSTGRKSHDDDRCAEETKTDRRRADQSEDRRAAARSKEASDYC